MGASNEYFQEVNSSVNSAANYLVKDKPEILVAVSGIVVTLLIQSYAGKFAPKLPTCVKNTLNHPAFKIIAMFLFLYSVERRSFVLSVCVAFALYMAINAINGKQALEAFKKVPVVLHKTVHVSMDKSKKHGV